MRLARPVIADEVGFVDGRGAFAVLNVRGRGQLGLCRECGGVVPLLGGLADARNLRHAPDCPTGRLLATVTKPLFLRVRGGEVKH